LLRPAASRVNMPHKDILWKECLSLSPTMFLQGCLTYVSDTDPPCDDLDDHVLLAWRIHYISVLAE